MVNFASLLIKDIYMDKTPSFKKIVLLKNEKPFLERGEMLGYYYNDIKNYRLLNQGEVIELLKLCRKGNNEERQYAVRKIFENNARLVVALARQYCSTHNTLIDLIQEGNIGLLKAIEKFDINKKCSFHKFALFYIRREINLFKLNQSSIVLKSNRVKTVNTVNKIKAQFTQKEERTPTDNEVLDICNEEYGCNLKNLKDVVDVHYVYIDNLTSSDGSFNDCEGYTEYNIQSCSTNEYLKKSDLDFKRERVQSFLSVLKPLEKEVIEHFYGVNGLESKSFGSIAAIIGMTPERVRQICANAIKKMQGEVKSLKYVV